MMKKASNYEMNTLRLSNLKSYISVSNSFNVFGMTRSRLVFKPMTSDLEAEAITSL